MAHERMFDLPTNNAQTDTFAKLNALYIGLVSRSGTNVSVSLIGGNGFSFSYGSDEAAAVAAYDLWVQRAEDAR